MGEVVVSSEEALNLELEGMEAEVVETYRNKKKMKKEDGSSAAAAVRWERLLPRTVLKVLLVEADDSTRQIISALLRKCSYKVTAVPDGLKAWELLKGKPHNIDLILTEVKLPSISGFALLTLIMEHEICKNIPVIMMSLNDSVSTVYNCMLRGAADFLVKPVRINELRNIWQHVWRRQALIRGQHGPQDDNVAQKKVEATAENNAASNQSSGCMACIQQNRDCIEKGSDAQSSCTKPDLKDERGYEENMQEHSQPKSKSIEEDMKLEKHEEGVKLSCELLMCDCEDTGLLVAACKDAAMARLEASVPESERDHANIISEACDVNSFREAMDLMGAFDDYPECIYRSCNDTNKLDCSLLLDLSLRRSNPSSSVNQFSDERQQLNHSNASAFSRYINQSVQPPHSATSVCNQQKDHGTNSDRQLSGHNHEYNSDIHGLARRALKNMLTLATGQSEIDEVGFPGLQQPVSRVQVPVTGIRFDNLCTAYGYEVPPVFFTQSGLSTVQTPGLTQNQELTFHANAFHPYSTETRNSRQFHDLIDQYANSLPNQTEHKQRQRLESSEDQRYFSSATDQSASSSFCNGNGDFDQVAVGRTAAESGNEEGFPIHDINSNRSVQREVALSKFRLKRKDRCYEKKVRYESRRKLAEQRPRVKGQFVRHVHMEPAPIEIDSHC